MKRFLRKWISTMLIAALCAGLIVVPERDAFAEDRPHVDIVAVLVESTLMHDTAPVAIREDLRQEFPGEMHNITLAARVRRYADDIQAKLPMAKIMIIPVSPDEEPWRIQEALAKLYSEGDGSVNAVTKLKGVVLVGGVPLPLVTKSGRSYVSLYPYTDFEDPVFAYNFDRQEFLPTETEGRSQPEVWHGVIPYPIAWEQYIREQSREQELSRLRIKEGVEAYNKRLLEFREEYGRLQRDELAHYFDKNHSFYTKGAYSLFSKKAIIMDIFHEFQAVSGFGLAGYQAYLENWDNKSYMRYTREWLADLQTRYFGQSATQLSGIYGTNPDGSTRTQAQLVEQTKTEVRNNPNLTQAQKDQQIRDLEANGKSAVQLEASQGLGITSGAVIPDIFTRDPIESFLHTASEVFGPMVSRQVSYFQNTGRWSLTGEAGDRGGFTLYKMVQQLDETSRKEILEVNTALENEVDTMLTEAASRSMHMQLDIPIAPINYFGRYTSFLYQAPRTFFDIGNIFNIPGGSLDYIPGHWFFLDLSPTPPRLGMPLTPLFDATGFLEEVEKPENKQKYIPYTGQKYTEIRHHMAPEKAADILRMATCAQRLPDAVVGAIGGPIGVEIGAISDFFTGEQKDKECTFFFDNPSPAQLKYIELYDPKSAAIPLDKQLEVQRYQLTEKLRDYVRDTKNPDIGYVSQQVISIGNTPLFLDFGTFIGRQPYNWQQFAERLEDHRKFLFDWNKQYIQFQVIVHVVDLPFTAQQCSIYLGGAPETATVGEQQYPLYLRGATSVSPERLAANSWEDASGNTGNLQNTANWRQEKVKEQVTLSLSSQERRIRAKEMEIEYVQDNPPRGDNVTSAQMDAWRERLRQLKEEKRELEEVRDHARTIFTQVWQKYYGVSEGDAGRFGDYLHHVSTLGGQTDLAKLVEANRLYDQGQDANIRLDNAEDPASSQRLDFASLVDPVWFGYDDKRLDKRPAAFQFPDWMDYARHGYWGGCAAPNLQRVMDLANSPTYTGYRQELENIFSDVRTRHIETLERKGDVLHGWLSYVIAPLAIFNGFSDFADAQNYYVTITLYTESLYNILEKMMSDDAYMPEEDTTDAIEGTVLAYKKILKVERDALLRDLTEQEYNTLRTDTRAILRKGILKLSEIERGYQEVMSKKAEDRPGNPKRLTLTPRDYGLNAPAQEFAITDQSSRDNVKNALFDLVQGEYQLRLLREPKIRPQTLQGLNDFGAKAVRAGNAAMAIIDGELRSIITTTTVAEALVLVGLTCDPQRALEPIFDRAGGKALTDPGYLPMRTTSGTVTITEANTLAPSVVSGNTSWTKPESPLDPFAPKETHAPPRADALLSQTVYTWQEPILQERLIDNESAQQIFRDDYPKTRDEVLYDPAQTQNSYEQGWQYTRKGYVVTQDQPEGTVKNLNGALTPETSYLACLRYATYGMDPNTLQVGQPTEKQRAEAPYYGNQYVNSPQEQQSFAEGALQENSSDLTRDKKTGWPLLNRIMNDGVNSVTFSMAGEDNPDQETKNVLERYLKDYKRMMDSESGGWKLFPDAKDNLEVKGIMPFEYTGKWDFKFEYIIQTSNKLEEFFQTALRGNPVDSNDPAGRRQLYSLYGVRRVATVIPHKEPTNETIAKQLQSMSATSLPVNNPRYVDFYLYEPIPQFNRFGEVETWKEYEEHISIPYVNFFRAFPEDKYFSYVMDSNREQLKRDLTGVEERMTSIMKGFNNYLVDYVAKTSMSGPQTTLDSTGIGVDLDRITSENVRRDVVQIQNAVQSQMGQGAKDPRALQSTLQNLVGGTRATTALDATQLEGIGFDENRFNTVLAATSLGEGVQGDRVAAAKQKLAFNIYWQHMTLAEKYKYVLHNYLTSNPDPVATDMRFWNQTTKYTAPTESQSKVGFEAGTIILESGMASRMQIPLENIQGARKTTGSTAPLRGLPTQQITLPEEKNGCDDEYAALGGNRYGVPLENWGGAIVCWATHIWPLQETPEQNSMNLETWGRQAAMEAETFASQTGRTLDSLVSSGNALKQGAILVLEGGKAALDSAGKWLGDTDQDGLSSLYPPPDYNTFSGDAFNAEGQPQANGFRDGQDAVKQLRIFAGREAITVGAEGGAVQLPAGQKQGVIPFGSAQPLDVKVTLLDKDGQPLLANNFDFVRLSILPEDMATSVVLLPASEQMQRVQDGTAVFRVFARNANDAFGSTRLQATLLRQQLPNSSYEPVAVPDVKADYAVTVTPEVLSGAFYRIPCSPQERSEGTCARGDVREGETDSIFSSNEGAHMLSVVATNAREKGSIVERSGRATVRYYKGTPDPENLYKKAMGGRDSLQVSMAGGTYAAAFAVPKESGKYFLEFAPEESLGLAPLLLSFLVVDTTYTTMKLVMEPSVAIEGQTIKVQPTFTNLNGETVDIGLGQASIGIPKAAELPMEQIAIFDGLPGGDTDTHTSIDIVAGKAKEVPLTIPDSEGARKDAYTIDLILSKLSPLSQVVTQAGSMETAVSQGLVVSTPLTVYPKGALTVRASLPDGTTAVTVPALQPTDTECLVSAATNASRAFGMNVEIRDKESRIVPYTGTLELEPEDFSLFTQLPGSVELVEGRGSLTVVPSRKAGTTKLTLQDAAKAFNAGSITVTLTPGSLAALRFTTQVVRPLEAVSEQNGTPDPDTMLPLRYVGLDLCGNPVAASDTTTIALDMQPALGDGKQLELLPLDTTPLGQAEVQQSAGTMTVMKTQQLQSGRNTAVLRALNFRGEATVTVRALTTDGTGKTVVNQRITPDAVTVPVRLTLRKELLESLEPNILYTNLLGGPYGDVTQKDFLGAWWMLTGKTQVVTTSTVASEVPANLAKVLPNGAIDFGERPTGGASIRMFAEPKLETNLPFTVDVKDAADGVTVMQVRYNIVPFLSGALFENYAGALSADQTAALAPGIYVVPAPGVTTRKDLLAQSRSVVRFFTTAESTAREEAIMADNLQFFPGSNGTTGMPVVAMETERRDVMMLRLQNAENLLLATLYVKLDPQRVFPAEGDYARDIQLTLDTVKAEAVSGGAATVTNGNVQLSDLVLERVADAEAKAPLLAQAAGSGLRYLRRGLERLENLGGGQNGIFSRLMPEKLLRVVNDGDATGLYSGDKLIFPLRNLGAQLPTVQAWLGANTLKYQLQVAPGDMKIDVQYTNGTNTLSMLTLTPVYGAEPLSWKQGTMAETGWYLSQNQAAPYTYSADSVGLTVKVPKRTDLPGSVTTGATCSLPAVTENVIAAGILPTGETFTCTDGLGWEKTLLTAEGRQRLLFVLKERATGRVLTEVVLHFAGERAFRVQAVAKNNQDQVNRNHQGVYLTMDNDRHIWNGEQGQVVRKDALPGSAQGLKTVFSLTPAAFLQIDPEAAASGLYRTRLDGATTGVPTIILEEHRDGTWQTVATMALQLQEKAPVFKPVTAQNAAQERASTVTDILRVYLADADLIVREEANLVRVTKGTSELLRFTLQPFRIESIGAGAIPELLDVSHDRFQMRLKTIGGAEVLTLEGRFDSAFTNLLRLPQGSIMPLTLRAVPGLYMEEKTPLLQVTHNAERTLSRVLLGFEEVMTISKTGGQRIARPDLFAATYEPELSSGQFISFSGRLFGTEGLALYYSLASLPFDLRVLQYLQDQHRPALEATQRDLPGNMIRPRTATTSTGYLQLVGRFLDLRNLQQSLAERNSQFTNTTVSMPVTVTEQGYVAADLRLQNRQDNQSREGARLVYVPANTPTVAHIVPRNTLATTAPEGLSIVTDVTTVQVNDPCFRVDAGQLITCRDPQGIRIVRNTGQNQNAPVALIRFDGSYLVQDPAFALRLRLETTPTVRIFYTLLRDGQEVITDGIVGASSKLTETVRRGTPETDRQALQGTYVSYIATPTAPQAAYTLLQELPGVAGSTDTLQYCSDKNDPARTCQAQLNFAAGKFLQRPNDQFAWTHETGLKDGAGFTFPAFGYDFRPANTRVATLALLLAETPLTLNNLALTAKGDAQVRNEGGQLQLRLGERLLLRADIATGRLETVITLRAQSLTPGDIRLSLFDGATEVGELRLTRQFTTADVTMAQELPPNPGAGLYLTRAQNLLQVTHDFPGQTSVVQLAFDRLLTLRADGSVDIALPQMVQTSLPEDTQDPLRLTVNRANQTLDLGTSLVAFPLQDITARVQAASQQVAQTALETLPLMTTAVDAFGNLVTEAAVEQEGTNNRLRAAQLRPVFAPTRPQIVYTAQPTVASSLPSFQLNPGAFFNPLRNETYTVTTRHGNLYFVAPSAHPYWTTTVGKDPACQEPVTGGGIAAILLADGTRVLCDPLHTIDLGFNASTKLFTYTLKTLQGAGAVIGTVAMSPGDMSRLRVLTGSPDFHEEDKASNFALQGLYTAVHPDYAWENMQLRLTKGDMATLWSANPSSFMTILTSGRVWDDSAERLYVAFENTPGIGLMQRRLPLAWNVVERREVRHTDQGSEAWRGDVIAARLRLTLTDPQVELSLADTTASQTTPGFVCAPAKPEVRCVIEGDKVTIEEQRDTAVAGSAAVSSLPALLFRKDTPARWMETGLWNGSTRFDAGEKTGLARLELYGIDGRIRAVLQYRPGLMQSAPRVAVFAAGATPPALSTTQPEVQVLLASNAVRLLERNDFFILTVDEPVQVSESQLLQLRANGSVNNSLRRLQNLDVTSFDGTTATAMGSVGQFGFSLQITRDRLLWTMGNAQALLPSQRKWTLRTVEEFRQSTYVLGKGETVVEALKDGVTLADANDLISINRAGEVLAETGKGSTSQVRARAENIMTTSWTTNTAEETVVLEQSPALALVRMAGNPRIAASAQAMAQEPFTNVSLVPAGAAAPSLERAGDAYIQPTDLSVRTTDAGGHVLVERLKEGAWMQVARVDKKTLRIAVVDTNTYAAWDRNSTQLHEGYVLDINDAALARIRRQNLVPDLERTALMMGDFSRNGGVVSIEQREANAVRTLPSGPGKIILFGNTLTASADQNIRIGVENTAGLEPWTELTRQERVTEAMTLDPARLLVSSLDTLRYQIVPDTILPTMQRYTLYPVGPVTAANALATITRTQPYGERYTTAYWRSATSAVATISAPGLVVRADKQLVSYTLQTGDNSTQVRYAYDTVGTIDASGNVTSITDTWRPLVETARDLRGRVQGVLVKLFEVPYAQYQVRRNMQGYENEGIRNTIFVEARSRLGSTALRTILGADRPAAFELGSTVLTWNQSMVATALSSLVQYTHDATETAVLKFNITSAAGVLASIFIQTVADPSDASQGSNPDQIGTLPVDQMTQALDILGGTGIYVQIKAPEKGLLSLAYEPTGDSTNNLFGVALRDNALPLLSQNQINPQTIGVEDALLDEAEGLGYTGEYKNMLLFAGGNNVGESTLPYMSETLINLGDPVISLHIEESDRSNESFTDDMGTLIYSHTKGSIQQMVLFDIDQDGREDVVFTDGDGVLQVLRNNGGTPINWHYLGGSFEIPEGIRELLIMQLQDKKNLAVALGTPTQDAARSTTEAVTAVTAVDKSFVELKSGGDALLERCKTGIPALGKVSDASFGDLDGDGTDDLVVITDKNEIKAVRIDPAVDCNAAPAEQQRYNVATVDTIGMKLDGQPLTAPAGNVPQGYNLLPPGDVYARFNGALEETWDPLVSICPRIDPRKTTPVYPRGQVPTNMPRNPDMVFVPEPYISTEDAGAIGSDAISKAASNLRDNLPGSEGVYFSYQGNGEQMMRMLVAADLPYIRSGGQALVRYNEAFDALAKSNPFSCLASGFGGIQGVLFDGLAQSVGNVLGQFENLLSFASGPTKMVQFKVEADATSTPNNTLFTSKYARDLNGGIIQAGDTIAYAITVSNRLLGGPAKNIDIGDRFQQGTQLLEGSVVCQQGTTRIVCTPQAGGGLFGLYIPNLQVDAAQTITITYNAKVLTSPIPLNLQLISGDYLKEAMADMGKIFVRAAAQTFMDSGNLSQKKAIMVSTPAMATKGSFMYWRQPDGTFGADIMKQPPKTHPLMQVPVLGKVLESFGLIWNTEGELDPTARADLSGKNITDSTKSLNNLITNAFLASDRDRDGLVDMWDEDVQAPSMDVGDLSRLTRSPNAGDVVMGAIGSAGAGISAGLNKFDRQLEAVQRDLQNMHCQTGGCSLVPADWNTAFLAPGTDAGDMSGVIDLALGGGQNPIKDAIDKVAENTAYAVFATPTLGPPWFWPGNGVYDDVKLASQFRLYTSVTLSGRFAITACGGPYYVGAIDLPLPTGMEPNKNCYSYILPDFLNIREFCRDLADGLGGLVGSMGRMVSSGGYTAARAQKAGNLSGLADSEPPAAFVADQFVFETDRFKNVADADIGKAISNFMKDFRELGRGTAMVIPQNQRQPGFPAFVMDWLERQIHEVLAKLLKLPTITLIYPDPTIGFTRSANANNDTLEKRQAAGDLTMVDKIEQRGANLIKALETNTTEADLLQKQQREQRTASALQSCLRFADKAVCEDPERLNEELARQEAGAVVNMPTLPEVDGELRDAGAVSTVLLAVDNDLEEAVRLIAALPEGPNKQALQDRLVRLQGEWNNAQVVVPGVSMLPRTRELIADTRLVSDPDFRAKQLRAYAQLKGTEKERAALAACSPEDPVGCALQNADQSYRQFVEGVSLDSGTSLADTTTILDAGLSSNQLLQREVRGFSEVLGIIGSLPFVNIRMRDVVFYYPWLPPDRISEFLYHLQGVKNQSLQNFHGFYEQWAFCFVEPDAQGNVSVNKMLPPTFTVRENLQTTTRGGAAVAGRSVEEVRVFCIAAARAAQDGWAGIQGIENNINRIKEYGNIMNSMKQYLQWKTYIVGRLANLVSGVVNQISAYVQRQNGILASWRDTLRSIAQAIQTFQVLVDVFADYQKQCTTCQNQRGTDAAQFMDLIGNFIQLEVVAFPKWPDIEIDLSNINFRYDVVIPNLRFVPQEIQLPRISAISLPNLAPLPRAELDLMISQGLDIALPVLPALPNLPRLPELPLFRLPNFPDLPPPPRVPQLNAQIRLMVQTIGRIINIICLVQKNVMPVAESRVRSHIASLTTSPLIMRNGSSTTATTPTYEPTLDRIRLSTQVNITFDTNRPFGSDTYMWVFDFAAQNWNNTVRAFINPTNYLLRDVPQQLYGAVTGFVDREVTRKSVNAINDLVQAGGQTVNGFLQENVELPVTNFQQSIRESIQKKQQELAKPVAMTAEEQRMATLTELTEGDPLAVYLVDQLLTLETAMVESAHGMGVADAQSFVPELEQQIALLQSDSGLPSDMQQKAVKRLQKVVDAAKAPAPSIKEEFDTEQLPYIAGWRALEKELTLEESALQEAERTIARLDKAQTLEEFKSVLQDADMLATESFTEKPVASLGTQDSRNTEAQRTLEALLDQMGQTLPMDAREATMEKKILRETTVIAQAPEAGETGAPVAANIGANGAPLIAQNTGVVTGPAVTTATEEVPTSQPQRVSFGAEEEGAILIELPAKGGLITLMNYIPPAGLPVQVALAPLRGDANHPDVVVSMGSDIYIKYNKRSAAESRQTERYNGGDRVREIGSLRDLQPVLPAVQNTKVTGVDATSISLSFHLPARTRAVNPQGAFVGEEARYVLRVYNRILGRQEGETPLEYIILPVGTEGAGEQQTRLQSILQENTAAMPETVRAQLEEEAIRQGLPAERILLGVVEGNKVRVTLPVRGRETPTFMTILPRVQTENGPRFGLASRQLFAHPQRGQDTTPPSIEIINGENQLVPIESPVQLQALGQDNINDVVEMWWDANLLLDTDQDGDQGNDGDVVCSAATPCTAPMTEMSNGSSKATTPALNAPTLTKTWQPGDRGVHKVRVFAKDALGNISSRDVTLQVVPTEIRIEDYDQATGVVRGSVYPPQANKKLQLLRLRDKQVSELATPVEVMTDAKGRFTLQGVLPGQGTAVYDGAGGLIQP